MIKEEAMILFGIEGGIIIGILLHKFWLWVMKDD